MKITKTKGIIVGIKDLSKSSREIDITLQDTLDIVAGCFINIFIEINGEKLRRAYSISSDPESKKNITLSIRKNKKGRVSPLFWEENILGKELDIMGPLGLNTADKLSKRKLFLMGFGIGVSVLKSLLHDSLKRENIEEVYIFTGSRNEKEVLYKNLFNIEYHKKIVSVKHIVSHPFERNYEYKGYIQNHIFEYDFNNADIYICGTEKACEDLKKMILDKKPEESNFFIEGFH